MNLRLSQNQVLLKSILTSLFSSSSLSCELQSFPWSQDPDPLLGLLSLLLIPNRAVL